MGFVRIFLAINLVGLLVFSGCLTRQAKPELCYKVSNSLSKDLCFHRAAVRTGNEAYCTPISDASVKDNCFTDLAQGNTWVGADRGFID